MSDRDTALIEAAARARSAALAAADAEAMRKLCTERFVYTNASGRVFSLEEYLGFFIESGRMRWTSQELDEVRIELYGEAAVLTCRVTDRASFDGQPFEGRFRSTQVWVRDSGAWRCAAIQTTEEPG